MGSMLNVLKASELAMSSPTGNASLLVAASKLILATCESDFVDSRGGPGNHDENGNTIPTTKFNDVRVRRDAVIQYTFKPDHSKHGEKIPKHLLHHSTSLLQCLFWMSGLPVDISRAAPWVETHSVAMDALPFPLYLHQTAAANKDVRSSAIQAIWSCSSEQSCSKYMYQTVHYLKPTSWVKKIEYASDSTDMSDESGSGESEGEEVLSEDDFSDHSDHGEEDVRAGVGKIEEAIENGDGGEAVHRSLLLASPGNAPKSVNRPYLFIKAFNSRSIETGSIEQAFSILIKDKYNRQYSHPIRYYEPTIAYFYTTDGTEPLWELSEKSIRLYEENVNEAAGEMMTDVTISIPKLSTMMYTGSPVQHAKFGVLTFKAIAAIVPANWEGLEEELKRVYYGGLKCNIVRRSKVALRRKYLKASVTRNKLRLKSAVKRLSTLNFLKKLSATKNARSEGEAAEQLSDDPEDFHDEAGKELLYRTQHKSNSKSGDRVESNESASLYAHPLGFESPFCVLDSLVAAMEQDPTSTVAVYSAMCLLECALAHSSDLSTLHALERLRNDGVCSKYLSGLAARVAHGAPIPSSPELNRAPEQFDSVVREASVRGLSREYGAGTTTPLLDDGGRRLERQVSQVILRSAAIMTKRHRHICRCFVNTTMEAIVDMLQSTCQNVVRRDLVAAVGYLGLLPYPEIIKLIVSSGVIRWIVIEARGLYATHHTRAPRSRADGVLLEECLRTIVVYCGHRVCVEEFCKSGGLIDNQAAFSTAWEIEDNNSDFGYYLIRFFRQILRRKQNVIVEEIEELAALGTGALVNRTTRCAGDYLVAEIDKKVRSTATIVNLVGSNGCKNTNGDSDDDMVNELYETTPDNDFAIDLKSILVVVKRIFTGRPDPTKKWMAMSCLANLSHFDSIREGICDEACLDYVNQCMRLEQTMTVYTLSVKVSSRAQSLSVLSRLAKSPGGLLLWMTFESQERLFLDSSGNYFPAAKKGTLPVHVSKKSESKVVEQGGVRKGVAPGVVFFSKMDTIILDPNGIQLPKEFTISVWFWGGAWLKKGQLHTLIQSTNGDKIVCTDDEGRIGSLQAGNADPSSLYAHWHCLGVSLIDDEDCTESKWFHLCLMGYSRQRAEGLENQPVMDFFLNGKKMGDTLVGYRPESRVFTLGNSYEGGENWGPLRDFRLFPRIFSENSAYWNFDGVVDLVRSKVATNHCIPSICAMLASRSNFTRATACSAIANLALDGRGRSLLTAQWVNKDEDPRREYEYAAQLASLDSKIIDCNANIERLQLKIGAKNTSMSTMVIDQKLIKARYQNMETLQRRKFQLIEDHENYKRLLKVRLVDFLVDLSYTDESAKVRRGAKRALVGLY